MTEARTPLEQLRYCSLCPNICRAAWPLERGPYPEGEAPSAVAYLALQVAEQRLEATPAVRAQVSRLDVAEVCRAACPHGVDTPAAVRSLVLVRGA